MIAGLGSILKNIWCGRLNHKNKSRLFMRVLLYLPYQLQLQQLFEETGLAWIPQSNPRQYYHFALPYVHVRLENQDKLTYIQQHFAKFKTLKSELQHQFYQDSLLISEFDNLGHPFAFKAGYFEQFEKEGEWTFFLEDIESGERLYAVTGMFIQDAFVIGCFQGKKDIAMMRSFTKQCHGMRPHNMLFFCVTLFCKAMGCSQIYGVSNEAHTYNAHRKTSERIQFDYNQFWLNFTSSPVKNGWYIMPCHYPLKNIEDVKSKKRGMYRKRYEMLDMIDATITSAAKAMLVQAA